MHTDRGLTRTSHSIASYCNIPSGHAQALYASYMNIYIHSDSTADSPTSETPTTDVISNGGIPIAAIAGGAVGGIICLLLVAAIVVIVLVFFGPCRKEGKGKFSLFSNYMYNITHVNVLTCKRLGEHKYFAQRVMYMQWNLY